MARKKKEIIWPHLNDCEGDVERKWYVEYTTTHSVTGKKIRTRIYDGFESIKSRKERYEYANRLISEHTKKLMSGWRPFDPHEMKEFVDELKYYGEAKIKGRNSVTKSYILPLLSEYLIWKKQAVRDIRKR
jgi:hypothetical protein